MNILTDCNLDLLKQRLIQESDENLQKLENKLTSLKVGAIGELRLTQLLEKYYFPFPYKILHDVNLDAGGKFQIDCLIVTQHFILVLESKNISGKLSFEYNPDRLIREREDGQIDVYESPEIQVERIEILLRQWLEEHGIFISIIGAIVFTSSIHPYIEKGPQRIPGLFLKTIPVFINQKRKYFSKQQISATEIEMLSDLLKSENEKNQYIPFPLSKSWKMNLSHVKRGVGCNNCSRFEMKKVYGGWKCPVCDFFDKNAHIHALQEWFILIDKTITNRECREFLNIDDRHLVKRLLKSDKLIETGTRKGTSYSWKWD